MKKGLGYTIQQCAYANEQLNRVGIYTHTYVCTSHASVGFQEGEERRSKQEARLLDSMADRVQRGVPVLCLFGRHKPLTSSKSLLQHRTRRPPTFLTLRVFQHHEVRLQQTYSLTFFCRERNDTSFACKNSRQHTP